MYLKYVSYDDLKEYGATPTGTLNDDGKMIFDWGDESNWGDPTNGFKTSDYRPLTQLDGESVVTTPGWYDFTRQTDEGDGARYITVTQIDPETGEEVTRIVGVELKFTDNKFGDKSTEIGKVVDPGATVAAVPVGNNTLNENEVAVDEAELTTLREKALLSSVIETSLGGSNNSTRVELPLGAKILEEGQRAVAQNAVILEEGQKIVSDDSIILEEGQIAVALNSLIDDTEPTSQDKNRDEVRIENLDQLSSGLGADSPGNIFIDPQLTGKGDADELRARGRGAGAGPSESLGDGQGQGNSSSSGDGDGESSLAEVVNEFIQGDGDGGFETEEARGQGAPGQGEGSGGDAALGEDQTPETQRKRGLMLQPLMAVDNADDTNKTRSSLLKNLSEGSLLGTNLLDALALGGCSLCTLCTKSCRHWKERLEKHVQQFPSKNQWRIYSSH